MHPPQTSIVAIDLGTTHSLAAIWEEGRSRLVPNALGEFLTPSVVSIDADDTVLVGSAARERLQTHPDRTAAQFKRGMGTDRTYRLGARSFRAEELSAFVLKTLKADTEALLGRAVDVAVITVPAYFSDAQRHATRAAGSLAGFAKTTLLNEPTAAALAYGLHQDRAETQFLVFDLGGGTFDVSILQMFDGVMEVRSTAGDNRLGGDDIDAELLRLVEARLGRVIKELDDPKGYRIALARIEAAKKLLMVQDRCEVMIEIEGQPLRAVLSQLDLEDVIKSFGARLRQPIERAMRDARIAVSELDAVVLAGGSTRLTGIRTLATRMFGRFPETSLNPDEVVALGAAVQAGLLMKDKALDERVMTDVCPYSLGVEVVRQMEGAGNAAGFMSTILERNTVVPASRSQTYSPVSETQKSITLRVFQGENRRVENNIHLGDLEVPVMPGPAGHYTVEVRFTYDASGILEVEATPMLRGTPAAKPRQLLIESSGQRLSQDEIQTRLEAMRALKIHPRDRAAVRTLLAKAERIYTQLLGIERDLLGEQIFQFEAALQSQEPQQIETLQKRLAEAVARFDRVGATELQHE